MAEAVSGDARRRTPDAAFARILTLLGRSPSWPAEPRAVHGDQRAVADPLAYVLIRFVTPVPWTAA
ncbi:hypothetical protein [Actinoplanes sp. N902-109]|uniref:hypothetical protein n=1 Tax=Actinoplanes sp. (strain N902-109) TaxID=649831 RepID=UPI0003AA8F91|nr:hypothetical protein [Actinoplanes sp. N902-109]